jgi:cytochrome c553
MRSRHFGSRASSGPANRATARAGAIFRIAGLLFLLGAPASRAGPDFIDLRRIDPIRGDAAAGAEKAAVCFACHGEHGESAAPIFPRLAGQRPDYLYHRLVSFKRAKPDDPYYSVSPMTGLVAGLTDADMRNLALYFAAQTPDASTAPAPDATAAADARHGQAIFEAGDPSRGVPPCQGCHGADAGGSAVRTGQYAAYPELRGQYAPYVTARLTNFRDGKPHDTSSSWIMQGVARTLDDAAIADIAAWLGSLPLTPVRIARLAPADREAHRSASRPET